jgi:hypothetical protein
LPAGEDLRVRTEAGVLFEIGSGAVSGSATDQPKLQDGVEAEPETRFGLFSSTQDHAHADRRTLADIPLLIAAVNIQSA